MLALILARTASVEPERAELALRVLRPARRLPAPPAAQSDLARLPPPAVGLPSEKGPWPEADAADDPRFRSFEAPAPDNTWVCVGLFAALLAAVLFSS